jgi:hypothetical protein
MASSRPIYAVSLLVERALPDAPQAQTTGRPVEGRPWVVLAIRV